MNKMDCPKGYYEKDGRCVKSITIKRKGIYGKGFLSEPQSEQYSKIRKEEKIENPDLVEKQMGALNAFSHSQGSAHKDLLYSEKIGKNKRLDNGEKHNCLSGYEWISPHQRMGHKVKGHCRKVK